MAESPGPLHPHEVEDVKDDEAPASSAGLPEALEGLTLLVQTDEGLKVRPARGMGPVDLLVVAHWRVRGSPRTQWRLALCAKGWARGLGPRQCLHGARSACSVFGSRRHGGLLLAGGLRRCRSAGARGIAEDGWFYGISGSEQGGFPPGPWKRRLNLQ